MMRFALLAHAALATFPHGVESSAAFVNPGICHQHHNKNGISSSIHRFRLPDTFKSTTSASHSSNSRPAKELHATVEEEASPTAAGENESNNIDGLLDDAILSRISKAAKESKKWSDDFDLPLDGPFYALFAGIRSSAALGLKGRPFYLKENDIVTAMSSGSGDDDEDNSQDSSPFAGYFTFDDLAKALEEDFLDATRGSTDNRKGWKVSAVSTPRGSSFDDARMTLSEVNSALQKGTIIFNNFGAHVPKLAGSTLACTDASSLPCALNMYVTSFGKRTSAPPHTDRQDVIVVQTQGRKHWRVYTPPDSRLKPEADMYARGKGDDSLSLYSLEEFGCRKLLDVTLDEGDVLFIPAGFPHTTDTVVNNNDEVDDKPSSTTSIHLTFNFDTHVWDLDYLSLRRLALRRAGVSDSALGQENEQDNRYVGNANLLPTNVRNDLFENLPLGLLDDLMDSAAADQMIDDVISNVERISQAIDQTTYDKVPSSVWRETVLRLRQHGMEIFYIHRDMYLAAIEEGRTRQEEYEKTAHLTGDALIQARAMTPEKIQRMSLFRVKTFFEKINESKEALVSWSFANNKAAASEDDDASSESSLPDDWEFTLPLKAGDEVEADLGGAFFPAKVTKVVNGKYDVTFFDGDVMNAMDRDMIKLLTPPASSANAHEEEPPPGLTKKELKRWRKKQEKKRNKGGF